MRNKTWIIPAVALALLLVLGLSVYAAANYGSEEDPLITKSYLDAVVKPELLQSLETEMDSALAGLEQDDGKFHVLRLSSGQRLTGLTGTELLLRYGEAVAVTDGEDDALVDSTSGSLLHNGAALEFNHLYLISAAGSGFTASVDDTTVLVSGVYTLE